MKKTGFTLAEVLITLGIIGVVAAITMPSLILDTQSSQVGPKLAKAVANFEQASKLLMNDLGVDSLKEYYGANKYACDNIITDLAKYFSNGVLDDGDGVNVPNLISANGLTRKASTSNGNSSKSLKTKDGTLYTIYKVNPWRALAIDINGEEGPNMAGVDVFAFNIDEATSTLKPYGASSTTASWKTRCPNGQVPEATKAASCTASIVEQGYKVLYKMP